MINYYLHQLLSWASPALHLLGLGITVWAYRVSRKRGYLVIAAYFLFVLFTLLAMPSINRIIDERRDPDINEVIQQEMHAEIDRAIDRVLEKHGVAHAGPINIQLYFPFGPLILVAGLWLIARKEKNTETSNRA